MQAYDSVAVRGRRRARRHGPALQPPHGPRRHAALRPRAAGHPDDADPELLGRDEDELVGRQQRPAPRRPEEMFGRTMRISDDQLARLVHASCWSGPRRRATRSRRSSSSRASSSAARWGEEAARAAEEHFTRVVRRHEAPERARGGRDPRGARPPAGAPHGAVRPLDESTARRMIDQGGVKVNGEPVGEYDVPRAPTERSCRRGKRRSSAFDPLDSGPPGAATCLGRPEGRRWKVPTPRRQERLRPQTVYDTIRFLGGLWRESEAFLRRHSRRAAPVFENSTACVITSRPRSRRVLVPLRCGSRWGEARTPRRVLGTRPLSSSSR